MKKESWYQNEITIALLFLVLFIIVIISFVEAEESGSKLFTGNVINDIITTKELQTILDNTPAAQELPEGNIILSFYDGSGNVYKHFTIKDGKKVQEGFTKDYDFQIITGDYYITELQQTQDLCQFVRYVKEKQDYTINRKINIASALWKYGSMLKYKSCVVQETEKRREVPDTSPWKKFSGRIIRFMFG